VDKALRSSSFPPSFKDRCQSRVGKPKKQENLFLHPLWPLPASFQRRIVYKSIGPFPGGGERTIRKCFSFTFSAITGSSVPAPGCLWVDSPRSGRFVFDGSVLFLNIFLQFRHKPLSPQRLEVFLSRFFLCPAFIEIVWRISLTFVSRARKVLQLDFFLK